MGDYCALCDGVEPNKAMSVACKEYKRGYANGIADARSTCTIVPVAYGSDADQTDMGCSNCGAYIMEGDKFCHECGAKVVG